MARKSPLEDPETAAFAWARYRRIMRFMLLASALMGLVFLSAGTGHDDSIED